MKSRDAEAAMREEEGKVPFYAEGLKFTCRPGCDACCRVKGEVPVDAEEIRAIATNLRLPIPEVKKQYLRQLADGTWSIRDVDESACVLLDEEGQCGIYEARPRQCRNYPFWPEIMKNELCWFLESMQCPGIGEGELHDAANIKALLSEGNSAW